LKSLVRGLENFCGNPRSLGRVGRGDA